MAMEDNMKDWKGIAGMLRSAGMKEEDIDAAELLGGAVHTLDKLAFEDALPFIFHPSSSNENSPGGYNPKNYYIYVRGTHDDLVKVEKDLKNGWPPQTHRFISKDMVCYSVGSEIVRLRSQEQMGIELFAPEHAGKIIEIPILNQIIRANANIPELYKNRERFDAHVIGTYAITMIYEAKRDGLPEEQTVRLISKLVKLDAKKV